MACLFVKGDPLLHPGYAAFSFRSSTGFGHTSEDSSTPRETLIPTESSHGQESGPSGEMTPDPSIRRLWNGRARQGKKKVPTCKHERPRQV